MRRIYLALIVLFLYSASTFAQNEFKIFGQIKAYEGSTEDAIVRVVSKNITFTKIKLDKSGVYEVFLPYGETYVMYFEKPQYTTLKFEVNLILPTDAKQSGYRPLMLSFYLFKPIPEYNQIFTKTFHTIQYNSKIKGFAYDIDVDYMVQQRIVNAELFKQKLVAAQQGMSLMNDSIMEEKKYLALINQGTEFYNQKQFYAARKFFLEASKIKTDRLYPRYKLEDIKTEIERFQVRAELLGINLDSLITQELNKIKPKTADDIYYPSFVPLTDEQVEEIFKRDIKKQILETSSSVAEANRTLALMNDFFKESYKKITAKEFNNIQEAEAPKQTKSLVDLVKPQDEKQIVKKPESKQVETKQVEKPKPIVENTDSRIIPITKPIVEEPKTKYPKVINYSTYQDSLRLRYPEHRSIEISEDSQSKTTRVFMNNGTSVEIYKMIEYNWGATYYFIEEYPTGVLSIGYSAFMNKTRLHEIIEKQNK